MNPLPSGKPQSLPLSITRTGRLWPCCTVPARTPLAGCGGSWRQRVRAHSQALVSRIDVRGRRNLCKSSCSPAASTIPPFPVQNPLAQQQRWAQAAAPSICFTWCKNGTSIAQENIFSYTFIARTKRTYSSPKHLHFYRISLRFSHRHPF